MDMLTAETALELLERAVQEKGPDYVYPKSDTQDEDGDGDYVCLYRNADGSPSCIVGHVFNYLGVLPKVGEGRSARQAVMDLGLVTGKWNPTSEILQTAQRDQDAGATWGEALAAAREVYAGAVKAWQV